MLAAFAQRFPEVFAELFDGRVELRVAQEAVALLRYCRANVVGQIAEHKPDAVIVAPPERRALHRLKNNKRVQD